MTLLDIFRRRTRKLTSLRSSPGKLGALTPEAVTEYLRASARFICNKDLHGLHESFAGGASVYVWDGTPPTKRVQVTREAYFTMMATEFAKHAEFKHSITLDKVRAKSNSRWEIETVSATEFADGRVDSGRQRVEIGLIDGHALITSVELRYPTS